MPQLLMIGPSARDVSSSAHTMDFRRRQFFKTALGGVLTTLSGCAAHDRNLSHCPAAVSDFELTSNVPRSRQAVPSSANCAKFVEG
jgi:hypothetical protein